MFHFSLHNFVGGKIAKYCLLQIVDTSVQRLTLI